MASATLPLGFMLVSQAATCEPGLVSYQQIFDETKSGSLKIDPNLCHEGVWLLDHAIKLRLASRGGQRAFKADRGADPLMDAMWARWMSSASAERLGSLDEQAHRIGLLVEAGSSQCLEAALSRGVPRSLVQEKWKEQKSSALRSEILPATVRQDLLSSTRCLLRHGYLEKDVEAKALLAVKKSDMLDMLLDFGADPLVVPSPGIIDGLLASEIPASELGKMIDRLGGIAGLAGTPKDHIRRLSSRLEKKSLEQFRVEMRLARWSPSSRGDLASPVIAWARGQMEGALIASPGSPLLAWLSKQPSFCTPLQGQDWSEATWVWAALFARHPRRAEEFALRAQDMPAASDPCERVEFFHRFTQSEALPRWVEDAICGQISDLPGLDTKQRVETVRKKIDCWIGDGSGVSFLAHFSTPARRPPDPLSWLNLFPSRSEDSSRMQVMTLACWMAFVQEDDRLLRNTEQAWEEGARPLSSPAVIEAFSNLLAHKSGSFASKVGAWVLDQAAPHARPRLRGALRL